MVRHQAILYVKLLFFGTIFCLPYHIKERNCHLAARISALIPLHQFRCKITPFPDQLDLSIHCLLEVTKIYILKNMKRKIFFLFFVLIKYI